MAGSFSEIERTFALELFRAFVPKVEIAEWVGCERSTLESWIEQAGLTRPAGRQKVDHARVTKAREALEKAMKPRRRVWECPEGHSCILCQKRSDEPARVRAFGSTMTEPVRSSRRPAMS